MAADESPTRPHQNPFSGFDQSVERILGADLRLIYGFGIPILTVLGLIVLLALNPVTWLVVAIVVMEIAALCVVLTGFVGMLNEPHDDDTVPR